MNRHLLGFNSIEFWEFDVNLLEICYWFCRNCGKAVCDEYFLIIVLCCFWMMIINKSKCILNLSNSLTLWPKKSTHKNMIMFQPFFCFICCLKTITNPKIPFTFHLTKHFPNILSTFHDGCKKAWKAVKTIFILKIPQSINLIVFQ